MKPIALTCATLLYIYLTKANPAPSCRLRGFFDNFDERVALPIAVGPASTVGVEGALNYKSFSLQGAGASDVLIPPPSLPNFIGAGLVAQVSTGQAQFLPANSTVQYFNLESIAYACSINSNVVPVSCTIQVAGLKASQFGGTTAVKELVFDGGALIGGVGSSYGHATFPQPQFSGLVAVTINILSSAGTAPLTNALFDNVKYSACI